MTLETAPNEASTKDNIITSVEEERAAARQANEAAAAEQDQALNNQGQPPPPPQQQGGAQEAEVRAEGDNQPIDHIAEDFDQDVDDLPEFRPEEFFNLPVGESLSLEALQRRMNSLIVDSQQNPSDISTEDDYSTEFTSISESLNLINQAMNKLDQETTNLQSRFRDLLNNIIEDRNEGNSDDTNTTNNNNN